MTSIFPEKPFYTAFLRTKDGIHIPETELSCCALIQAVELINIYDDSLEGISQTERISDRLASVSDVSTDIASKWWELNSLAVGSREEIPEFVWENCDEAQRKFLPDTDTIEADTGQFGVGA